MKTLNIFGYQIKLEWYDVKTKIKQLIRQIGYSNFIQKLICYLVFSYMWLVYLTAKKKFINEEILLETIKNNQAVICCSWHNRLMMTPFAFLKAKKFYPKTSYMILASKHGDGKFVGKIMEKFGSISILGSTIDAKKPERGIDIASFRKILTGLKNNAVLGITPDGPKGPNQEINSEIINIAKKTHSLIIPFSYSCSRFLTMKTWDNFKIPLPFSRLSFCFSEALKIDENINIEEEKNLKITLKNLLNLIQNKTDEVV